MTHSSNSVNDDVNHVFSWPLRVYYEDTDAGGVVFYVNYLKFFERARTEWLRAKGYSQQQLVNDKGLIFVVKAASVDYMAPARLDDELRVSVAIKELRNASLTLTQQVWRVGQLVDQPQLLATGQVTIVCVNAETIRPQPIPAEMVEQIKKDV